MTDVTTNPAGVDRRIYDAVCHLCSLDSDRATVRNGQGWDGKDGHWAHAIAGKPFEQWSLKMGQIAHKMLRKYSNQLALAGFTYAEIPVPTAPAQGTKRQPQQAAISLAGSTLRFTSAQHDPAVAVVRALPQRTWAGAPAFCWEIALTQENLPGLRQLFKMGVSFDEAAIAALRALGNSGASRAEAPAAQSSVPAPAGLVRVAYMVNDQNEIVYRLKVLPMGRILKNHEYRSPQEAQTAADQMNRLANPPLD